MFPAKSSISSFAFNFLGEICAQTPALAWRASINVRTFPELPGKMKEKMKV